ncbi:MAG TPA: hypothetical protein VKV33_11610, partial [Streptosporangiaceae bacterium]|nr:hypothetical protein [Streptosporangiaceae bacterium]
MVVGQPQAEPTVDLQLIRRVGLVQDAQQAAERVHDVADLVCGHAAARGLAVCDASELGLGGGPLGLDFTTPRGDQRGVGSGFEGGAVAGELAVAVVDGPADGVGAGVGARPGVFHLAEGVLDPGGVECPGESGVERSEDGVLAQVDGDGVVDLVGDGVL